MDIKKLKELLEAAIEEGNSAAVGSLNNSIRMEGRVEAYRQVLNTLEAAEEATPVEEAVKVFTETSKEIKEAEKGSKEEAS